MVQYRNRITAMGANRLPRMLYEWDCSLGRDSWAREVEFVLQYANMYEVEEDSDVSSLDQHHI